MHMYSITHLSRTCTNLHELARTCTNLHELVRCTNLHELARTCTNLHELARTCSVHELARTCTNLHEPARTDHDVLTCRLHAALVCTLVSSADCICHLLFRQWPSTSISSQSGKSSKLSMSCSAWIACVSTLSRRLVGLAYSDGCQDVTCGT